MSRYPGFSFTPHDNWLASFFAFIDFLKRLQQKSGITGRKNFVKNKLSHKHLLKHVEVDNLCHYILPWVQESYREKREIQREEKLWCRRICASSLRRFGPLLLVGRCWGSAPRPLSAETRSGPPSRESTPSQRIGQTAHLTPATFWRPGWTFGRFQSTDQAGTFSGKSSQWSLWRHSCRKVETSKILCQTFCEDELTRDRARTSFHKGKDSYCPT